ncbi:Malate/lactate/ureidoglycolate dehydrogenase, LDH2 family [Paenibacillus sophorae]|uniref:Ldh family oxidoreductase n=1 Tax=Paenibacillus sophorae TaxID=1333845 RepID=A0A1H8Q5L4_9BACL|nr:Ldh family oxidoreductase [Paenibacillus sophorae]QWU15269.1 Ldh family oxidoreductase [Paenibacillus sophorae]SEO49204.1 Malate/lactate/ureidoglycolate dehydrogenase, LDH2 family [Paenibacillus sophorae]
MTAKRYDSGKLYEFVQSVLISLNVPDEDACITADSLIRADLEGHGSHGVSRLPVYFRRIQEGRINAASQITAERHGSVLTVDGGNGLGQAVAFRALREGIPIAREQGLAAVFVRGSNHFGTAAYLCQEAAKENMASVVMTNSPPGIAPWGGRSAFLGTNPIGFGFPSGDEGKPAIVADLSSSVVARGKIMQAQKAEQPIPEGWAIDSEGRPTTDAGEALKGAILPLGGAKGYALALAVEMLCGILTGASFGPHIGNLYKDGDKHADVGHVILLFSPARWLDIEAYYDTVSRFAGEIKEIPLSPGAEEILLPGERRFRSAGRNQLSGISLPDSVVSELEELAREAGVPFPPRLAHEEEETRKGNEA